MGSSLVVRSPLKNSFHLLLSESVRAPTASLAMADKRPSSPKGSKGPRFSWLPRAALPPSQSQLPSPASAGSQQSSSQAIGASSSHRSSPSTRSAWDRSLSPNPLTGHSSNPLPGICFEHVPAARAALQDIGVIPRARGAASNASVIGGDEVARLDSLPSTPEATLNPASARAAASPPGPCLSGCVQVVRQGDASADVAHSSPTQQSSPAAKAVPRRLVKAVLSTVLQHELEERAREEIEAKDLVKAEREGSKHVPGLLGAFQQRPYSASSATRAPAPPVPGMGSAETEASRAARPFAPARLSVPKESNFRVSNVVACIDCKEMHYLNELIHCQGTSCLRDPLRLL